jgi:hypothetical protein
VAEQLGREYVLVAPNLAADGIDVLWDFSRTEQGQALMEGPIGQLVMREIVEDYLQHLRWAEDAKDTDWLPKAGRNGWAIGRDAKSTSAPAELDAYMQARVQVYLLPGPADDHRIAFSSVSGVCGWHAPRGQGRAGAGDAGAASRWMTDQGVVQAGVLAGVCLA